MTNCTRPQQRDRRTWRFIAGRGRSNGWHVRGPPGYPAGAGSTRSLRRQVEARMGHRGVSTAGSPGRCGSRWRVQHGSTATGLYLSGPRWTSRDGDLRGWTWVDVLPVVCKQGVRGSSPLSSTGQRHNSNSRAVSTAAKYRNRDRVRCRTRVRGGLAPRGRLRPAAHRSQVLSRDSATAQEERHGWVLLPCPASQRGTC